MNDTARPLQMALIGYGFVGKAFHAPLINAVPGLELSVVASRDAAKVHADLPHAQVIADPLEAIRRPEVDLVVIASPNDTHAPLALAALEAGKHVVVDKPFTLDLAQARTLIAAAEKHDRLLSVFQNRRWDSDFLGVKQVIEQGLIGKVTHFESHIDRYRPEVRVRWREQNLPGSGLWFDLGPHMVDQALQLFGLPHSVQANIATLRPNAEVNDWAHVVLNYPTHRVILHGSMLVAGGVARFTVHGEKGSVVKARADGQESQLLAGVTPGSAEVGQRRRRDEPVYRYGAGAHAADAGWRPASVLCPGARRAARRRRQPGYRCAGAGGDGGAGGGHPGGGNRRHPNPAAHRGGDRRLVTARVR